ncbi:MAG: FAD-binding oxidoreductase [Gammaproteobacteria bacterium]|nr:FAD-binding oxidoreductase [Gammaproteobacteria bacterium]
MGNNIPYKPDLGVPGWLALLPERQPRSALQEDIEVDYCIVGAGFAGLAAARRIRQLDRNASIAILDATSAGSGPAGRNSGFMIDLPHIVASSSYAGQLESDMRDIKLNRSAIEFVGNMVREFNCPQQVFRIEGKVNAAAGKSGVRANENYARHLERMKEPCEMLNSNEMERMTGTDYYLGGLHTPGVAMIQPAMLNQQIADGLVNQCACKLFENTAVTSIHKQRERWKFVTESGSVVAGRGVLAVNGFVEKFGFYQRRLMHVNLYASMTRELTTDEISSLGGESRWGITPSNPFGSTVRRISDSGGHRIVIRNRFSYDPDLFASEVNLEKAKTDHRRSFEARFPELNRVRMEYCWSGRICASRNHVWALGKVADHLYSACCQNGLGASKGVIAGIVAAEMACDSDDDRLMPDYRQEIQPEKLIPEPFMSIGAGTYLKCREWIAGRDK